MLIQQSILCTLPPDLWLFLLIVQTYASLNTFIGANLTLGSVGKRLQKALVRELPVELGPSPAWLAA